MDYERGREIAVKRLEAVEAVIVRQEMTMTRLRRNNEATDEAARFLAGLWASRRTMLDEAFIARTACDVHGLWRARQRS